MGFVPRIHRRVGLAAAAGVLTLFGAGAAAAQVVTGRVTEENGLAVPGALIRLLDDAGQARAGVLSDSDGRYRLRAPAPGTYQLRAQRIGLSSVTAAAFTVDAGGAHVQDFELRSNPIELEGIVAWGRQRCDLREGEGTALLALWEEARTAFEVVAHTRDAAPYRLEMHRFTRELDPESGSVLSESARTRTGYWSGSPFVALDPDDLMAGGFVRPERDGSIVFYLPDVDVLLSDAFHDAHCFRLLQGPDPGTVGIGIEPDRRREGLNGTLWIDRATHEVRRLEYSLASGTTRARGMPPATGAIVFDGLPSGAWIVRSWNVRMPIMALRTSDWRGQVRSQLVVDRVREEGGEVTEVGGIDRDG